MGAATVVEPGGGVHENKEGEGSSLVSEVDLWDEVDDMLEEHTYAVFKTNTCNSPPLQTAATARICASNSPLVLLGADWTLPQFPLRFRTGQACN